MMKFWSEFLPITLFGFGLGSFATSVFYQKSAIWKRILSEPQTRKEIYVVLPDALRSMIREEVSRTMNDSQPDKKERENS